MNFIPIDKIILVKKFELCDFINGVRMLVNRHIVVFINIIVEVL